MLLVYPPLHPTYPNTSFPTGHILSLLLLIQLLHSSLLSLPALSLSLCLLREQKIFSSNSFNTKVQFSFVSKCKQSFGCVESNHDNKSFCDIFVYHQLGLVCVYLSLYLPFLSCQTTINPLFSQASTIICYNVIIYVFFERIFFLI